MSVQHHVSSKIPGRPFREQRVGEIAATLPGATALFRASRIDFCCNGDVALDEAARARGVDVDALEASLEGLRAASASVAPESTEALLQHIVTRYHDTHRRELAELIRLARRVEAVHARRADAPQGLADALESLCRELLEHMEKEETILFPAMQASGEAKLGQPLERMQQEHREHGAHLERLEQIAHDFEVPTDACGSWCALYAGTAKFVEDVREHIHLENNVLFPRFLRDDRP